LPSVPKIGMIILIMGTMTTTSLGSALFGKTRLAILSLLYGQVDRSFYLSEIVRLAGVGRGAVQRELARLTRAGLLVRTEHGQQVYFQANAEAPVFEELRGLVRKTAGIVDLLRLALSPLTERISSAYVYGSIARGEETATSDIDLLVVGDVSLFDIVSATAGIRETLGRELNPTVFPPAEYADKVRAKDHFLTTVLAEPKLHVIGGNDEPE
jgi:predicted nucleotidyltransferase